MELKMTEQAVQQYLNPLTLEAFVFANSLEQYAQTCNQMDEMLYKNLENVVVAIEKFLEQKPQNVVKTANTKFVPQEELNNIQRIFHCTKCRLDLGRTAEKATVHLVNQHHIKSQRVSRKEKRKEEAERRNNKVIKLPKKAASFLSSDFEGFFLKQMQVAETLKYIPQYDTIEKDLLQLLTPVFPKQTIKLYKFGSRFNGVGQLYSDLDIFVDIGNTFNTFENRASQRTLKNLGTACDALRKCRKSWPNLVEISNARVPIIRVLHANTGIECDIGFSNSLGYCNTKLLEYLLDLQPIARHMCLFLKKWSERCKISEIMSSYSMSLMVIFYFQRVNLLPAVYALQPEISETTVCVGPWIGSFLEKSLTELNIGKIICTEESCIRLINAFFKYYAEFDFATYVVCPFVGKSLKINLFEQNMPERYTNYVKNVDTTVKGCGLELNKPMVVQDPIQLNHNVTKAISAFLLKKIIEYFRQSSCLLTDTK